MPDKGKKSTSAPSSKGRIPSSSHSGISNSGRSMPPTTRSMQGRLSGTSQASSPQAHAGPSRAVQQGTPQRAMTAAVTRGSHAESSDEDEDDESGDDDDNDDDDDDDDDEDDEDDDGDSDDDGEDSDDDENNVTTHILKIFAMVEPNGLVKSEIVDGQVISQDQANNSSLFNRRLLNVIATEANKNQPFYDAIKAVMTVPGDPWSSQMYEQLRTRLEITIARFDRSSSNTTNPFDVVKTSKRLEGLIKALKSMTQPARWRKMKPITRLNYFGLVLDVLRYVVARDRDHRIRPASGGSSPYVVDPPMNHNLYQRMVGTAQCAHAMNLLNRLVGEQQAPLDSTQADQIRNLYSAVKDKDRATHTDYSGDFVGRLRQLRDAVVVAMRPS